MRISDWGSDVCSSDLFSRCGFRKGPQKARKNVRNPREKAGRSGTIQGPIPLDFCGLNTLFEMFREEQMVPRRGLEPPRPCDRQHLKLVRLPIPPSGHGVGGAISGRGDLLSIAVRSEEHTSELQSLMRN